MSKWLENSISFIPQYCLLLSEKEYKSKLIELNIEGATPFRINNSARACVKHFDNSTDGSPVCLVCLYDPTNLTVPEVCSVLAHEAVHIYQRMIEFIGELKPGDEFMAYSIQTIVHGLISEFFNRKLKKLV